jgi:HptB-dependent secretion and biofilm anti anti-sigma factor
MPASVERTGEIARIILSGDFDFSTQANLADVMDRAVAMTGVKEIRVDMSQATFIDSSVIRALLKLQERAAAAKKSLSIWNCNEHIREIFSIGGFDQMFVIY